jgi:hypothetical protein
MQRENMSSQNISPGTYFKILPLRTHPVPSGEQEKVEQAFGL